MGPLNDTKPNLVANMYLQKYVMDCEETLAPVAKIMTVRTLIIVSSIQQWKIFQMDVNNAFLNDDLNKDMDVPPPGIAHRPCKVYHL